MIQQRCWGPMHELVRPSVIVFVSARCSCGYVVKKVREKCEEFCGGCRFQCVKRERWAEFS